MQNLVFKNSKVYDVLKFIAQIVLPAVGALYFAIAQLWGFPYGAEIVGTISAVDAFLGVILGISNANYKAQIGKSEETYSEEE